MALPREYTLESCPIAYSLEIVGERWSLLIVRDAFWGARRFSDFRAHLNIPKAVLSERLALLVREGVFIKTAGPSGRDEYELTDKGRRLWPTLWSLINWGNENYVDKANRWTFRHVECGGVIQHDRACSRCRQVPDVGDLAIHPPRRLGPRAGCDDPLSRALQQPHRLLEPIRTGELEPVIGT